MAALPSLRQLGYLVTLADTLHFTEAARRCFVTQSTLSGGIMELERLLGGALVERSRQQVRLTPLGKAVVARAVPMLADAHDLINLAQEMAEPFTGEFNLGVIPTIAPYLLQPILSICRRSLPRLTMRLHEAQSALNYQRLQQGELDAVLLALPFATEHMHVHELWSEPLYLVSARQDERIRNGQLLDDSGNELTFANLPTERLLLLEEGHCLRDHVLSSCAVGDQPNPANTALQASSLTTLLAMVRGGLGYSLLPEMAVKGLEASPDLQITLLPDAPQRTLALLSRRSTTRLAETRKLAQLLQQYHSALTGLHKP